MLRALGHRVLVLAGLLAVLSGLLDARAWGDFADLPDAPGKPSATVHSGLQGPLELLQADPFFGGLSGRVEAFGRIANPGSPSIAPARFAAPACTNTGIRHVAALPPRPATGPAGSGHPLLLGGDEPHVPAPVA